MPYDYNEQLTPNSQKLRKNMTPEEKHLWYDFLKLLPTTVNRQKAIGEYIVDFYIHSAKLVIEIDGKHHRAVEYKKSDEIRDAYLKKLGITVFRFSNDRVRNHFNLVCDEILMHIYSENK